MAGLINAGDFESVQEVVEGDVITIALLLVRCWKLLNPRARSDVVEDRMLRQIEELKSNRGYVLALRAHRTMLHRSSFTAANNDPTPSLADDQIAA